MALYLEKMVHDPMFFFIESIRQHPYLIVLEGQKILSEDQKLTKNPINFPHELKLWPDVQDFTGTGKL